MSRASPLPRSGERSKAVMVGCIGKLHSPSLRAQRSNPDCRCEDSLDCFVARTPRNDGVCDSVPLTLIVRTPARRAFRPGICAEDERPVRIPTPCLFL